MSKEEVFEYLKRETYNKFDNGEQVKINVQDIISNLQIREQTVYKNLEKLKKWSEVKHEKYKITRLKDGKRYRFKMSVWWCE